MKEIPLFPLQLPLGRDRVETDAEGKPPQPFQPLLSWESPGELSWFKGIPLLFSLH